VVILNCIFNLWGYSAFIPSLFADIVFFKNILWKALYFVTQSNTHYNLQVVFSLISTGDIFWKITGFRKLAIHCTSTDDRCSEAWDENKDCIVFWHYLFMQTVISVLLLLISVIFYEREKYMQILYIGDSDVISSYHIYGSCFPPFCGASCAKCLLLWHHFHTKIVIIQTFS